MTIHVSQCMAKAYARRTYRMSCVSMYGTLKAINMVLFVEGGSNKKEKERKKKGEGKKGKKGRKRKERERRRRGKRKEPAGFPSIDDASMEKIHRTEKQSSSTQ